MKNKILPLTLLSLGAICLTACGSKTYASEHYVLIMDFKDEFRVLQLGDIHIGNKDNRDYHLNFIKQTFTLAQKDSPLDLVVLNGDNFTFGDKESVYDLTNFLEQREIPWTITFGNHDEQCYFSVDWLTNYLNNLSSKEGSYCVFKDIQDDDLTGNANFVIDLKSGNESKFQIYVIDSNRYCYGEYWGYDVIHEEQVEWYGRMVDHFTKDGVPTKSISFCHIPFPEMQMAMDKVASGELNYIEGLEQEGEMEPSSCPKINTGMFDMIKRKGSTIGCFFSHDHVNNFSVEYEGVILSYGVHSTNRIYYDLDDHLGGQVITIRNGNSLKIERIFHAYEEVE